MERSGSNPWQPAANETAAKTAQISENVAVGCDALPRKRHGKEGVDGSSPSEGFEQRSANWLCLADGFVEDGVGAETGVGRRADVGLHQGRVNPQPAGAQHLALAGERKQPHVQLLEQVGAEALGQLHQRRGIGHAALERDPAEPAPGEGVRDLLHSVS